MFHLFIRLVSLLVLSSCALQSDWTPADTRYETVFQIVNTVDAYTTAQIRHNPEVVESAWPTRSIIGSNPTEGNVALLFVTYGISHYVIARCLPPKWRRYYQVGTIGYSSALVINNCQSGLCK